MDSNVEVVEEEISIFLEDQIAAGKQADLIFLDADKTCYPSCYAMIMKGGLLKTGGLICLQWSNFNHFGTN